MDDRQKRWFICLEIEARKSRSKAPAVTKPRTQHKTSSPVRKSMKPQVPNMKKKFTTSRKVWPDCWVCCDDIHYNKVISFLLVIHNQSLYDIWSIKMCGVSTFLFLSQMTRCNNSLHTTPSAFIWSPAIFVFITHSAVTVTHTATLVTSRWERVDQSKECQVIISPHKCLRVCRRYCGAELSYWPRPRIVHCPLAAGGISLVRIPVLCVQCSSPTFNSYSTKLDQTQLEIWNNGIIKYLPFQCSHLWPQPLCPALCNVSVSNVTMNNGCRLRLSETQGMTINRIINRVSPGYHYTTYGPCDACYAVTILFAAD